MRARRTSTLAIATLVAFGMLAACAPSAQPNPPGAAPQATTEPPRTPKVLTVGIQREPSMFHNDLTQATESSGGLGALKQIPQNFLVVTDDREVWVPQLAAEQISAEK